MRYKSWTGCIARLDDWGLRFRHKWLEASQGLYAALFQKVSKRVLERWLSELVGWYLR